MKTPSNTRAWLRAVTLAAVVSLVLAACGGGSYDQSESSGTQPGGTLTVALPSDITTMDPAMHRSRVTQAVVRNVFDGLVNQDAQLEIVPELATSWESSPDQKTWTFKLRQGVKFHNGEPFDAEAVKFSIERVTDPATNSPRASMLSMVDSVTAQDPTTVVITTKEPSPILLANLAVNEIVPPKYVQETGAEGFAAKPVGTGPFTFQEWKPNERVALEANADYWAGAPKVGSLVFRPIPEVAARMAALQSGDVQIAAEVPPDLAGTLSGDVEAADVNGTRSFFLAMNVTTAPFDRREVREGVNYAVDRESLVTNLLKDYARPLYQPLFPEVFGAVPDYQPYKHDPAKAASMLGGLTQTVQIDAEEKDRLAAQAVAGQLGEAGLQASVNVLETQAFTERIEKGESQAYLSSWGVAEGDADVIFARHFWSDSRAEAVFTAYENPTVDRLVVEGRSTGDPERRREIYKRATELVMRDAPWAPLYNPDEIYGVSTQVQGFEPSPIGRYNVANVSLAAS